MAVDQLLAAHGEPSSIGSKTAYPPMNEQDFNKPIMEAGNTFYECVNCRTKVRPSSIQQFASARLTLGALCDLQVFASKYAHHYSKCIGSNRRTTARSSGRRGWAQLWVLPRPFSDARNISFQS